MAEPLLELAGVGARYVRRTILRGVDLTVAPGEIVALLGPNGAGKSTVLKAVFGLVELTAGTISLAGHSLAGARPREILRRGVAYLPQGGQVFAPLTVAENLQLAATYLAPGGGDERIAEVLAPFDELRRRLRQRAGTLSGGQRQQLALAMALLPEPRLLLADEPTIGLAAPLARAALERLAALARDRGTGVLLVEQNVGLALATARRAVLLVAGRTVEAAEASTIRGDEERLRRFTLGLEPAGLAEVVDS